MSKVFRVAFEAVGWKGAQIVQTHHVVSRPHGAAIGDPSADEVRDAMDTALTAKYRDCLTTLDSLTGLMITEEVPPGSGDVPAQSFKSLSGAGTRAASSQHLSPGLTIMSSVKSNAAVRGGRGRAWGPPCYDEGQTAADGKWLTSGSYWTKWNLYMDAMTADHDIGGPIDYQRLSAIVYSRTRRARGEANYYFDITGYSTRPEQHFLRSRVTAP